MAPRPAFLLRSGDFVAQDSLTSFAHYDSGGRIIARFAPFDVRFAAITPDETRIVLSNYDGKVAVADLKTGQVIWSKSGVSAPSFSQDGSACVICDHNQITVLDGRTGILLGGVRLFLHTAGSHRLHWPQTVRPAYC